MPTLLLKLKNVPDDEYEEICELLISHHVEYYETSVGFWGIGMAAIWLRDAAQLDLAHDILNTYTKNRQEKAKQEYKQKLEAGEARTILSTFSQQPIMFVLYGLALFIILGLSIVPFLGLL